MCELTHEGAKERTSGQNSIQVRWRLAFAQVRAGRWLVTQRLSALRKGASTDEWT